MPQRAESASSAYFSPASFDEVRNRLQKRNSPIPSQPSHPPPPPPPRGTHQPQRIEHRLSVTSSDYQNFAPSPLTSQRDRSISDGHRQFRTDNDDHTDGAFLRPPNQELVPTEPPLSISGMEAVAVVTTAPTPQESSNSDELSLVSARSQTDPPRDTFEATLQLYNEIRSQTISVEDTELIIKRLQKQADSSVKRSYHRGLQVPSVIESAPVLKVGLSFLAGSDDAKVTRMEQTDMMKQTREPEQMSPLWRVNTAGALLQEFDVTPDLSVLTIDRTSKAAERAMVRLGLNGNHHQSRAPQSRHGDSYHDHHHGQDRRRSERDHLSEAVTIDSSQVVIVHDLNQANRAEYDLASTLVEVDGPSMMNLLVRYKKLIQRHGPSLNPDETKDFLEMMMEDVRRLCHRSPILFRMSTRSRIITSKDTRYGINHGRQFTTLTTSRGIQEIIGHSSSYYTTLDSDPVSQRFVKPRFLQMLVLLLSLINDDDLCEIREFIEHTFKFKADRASLELLILKVIPLRSINSKVFITALIPTFEGWAPYEEPKTNEDFQHHWDVFVQRILAEQYILPGTVSSLGRKSFSWVVEWPSDGFKDSSIFSNLQYGGDLQMFNHIPRVEDMHRKKDEISSLTVVLTNDDKYTIRSIDYDGIIRLVPNTYTLQEPGESGRLYDLDITEIWLNQESRDAVNETNKLIRLINAYLAPPALRRRESIIGAIRPRREPAIALMDECRYSGRVTKHIASFGNSILAIAYKLDGRKITKSDVVSVMSQDNREIRGVVEYYSQRLRALGGKFDAQKVQDVEKSLHQIQAMIERAEGHRSRLSADPTLTDEPIAKVILPSGDQSMRLDVWYPYKTWTSRQGHLSIDGAQSLVQSLEWLSDDIIEVRLRGHQTKYFVSPLEEVDFGKRPDQIQEDDVVILAGQYMIVAEAPEDETNRTMYCANFLKISWVEEPPQTERGRKRRQAGMARGGGGGGEGQTSGDTSLSVLF